jgi:hypothetical protein
MYFFVKILISAVVIAAVSEIARRSTWFGALIASLPLTSLLALIWLYQDTRETGRVAQLSMEIFWLVIPSLLLFVMLPLLLRRGVSFYPALSLAAGCTIAGYFLMFVLLQRVGVRS